MSSRLNWREASPKAFRAVLSLSTFVNECSLEPKLLELVKLRTSQINGCAYCIDMHTKDARAAGESEQRLYLLSAWRETPHLYDERERAALAWTESVTRIGDGLVPAETYDEARAQFRDAELVDLTTVVAIVNMWNRLNTAFHVEVGNYQPGQFKRLKSA
jgi:AhpD family alkylhydroperoxidase